LLEDEDFPEEYVLLPEEYVRPLLEDDLEPEDDLELEDDLLPPPAYAATSLTCAMKTLQIRKVETKRRICKSP
jgi:hypothetical protein